MDSITGETSSEIGGVPMESWDCSLSGGNPPAVTRPRHTIAGGSAAAIRHPGAYFDVITQTPFQSSGGSAFSCSQRSM